MYYANILHSSYGNETPSKIEIFLFFFDYFFRTKYNSDLPTIQEVARLTKKNPIED